VPVARAEVAQVATPDDIACAVQPVIGVAPSRNCTVPVGVPLAPDTVAVKVTDWPLVDGFAEEVRATVATAASAISSGVRPAFFAPAFEKASSACSALHRMPGMLAEVRSHAPRNQPLPLRRLVARDAEVAEERSGSVTDQ
jgi:hypothetical protein